MPRLRRPGPPPWWSPLATGQARSWPGRGTVVVLVHGPGQSSRSLVPLGRRLAALGLPVLAPDLPAPDVEAQGSELLRVLDAAGLEQVVLVGCSGGSRAAVEAAVRAPERVRALVLSGPSVEPEARPARRHAARVLLGSLLEVPSRKPQLLREDLRPGLLREVRRLRRDGQHRLEDPLPRVRVPSVVVRGVHDLPVSDAWARTVAGLLPDAVLVQVEGAAHDVHWSAPQVLARLVARLVQDGLPRDGLPPDGAVVPRAEADDALAPPHLLGPRGHAALELATALVALAAPVPGARTRTALRTAGALALANALLADGPSGLVRRVPLTLHRNLDSGGGLLLLALAGLLRQEPRAGRLALAALGLGAVVVTDATASPVGPARVVGP